MFGTKKYLRKLRPGYMALVLMTISAYAQIAFADGTFQLIGTPNDKFTGVGSEVSITPLSNGKVLITSPSQTLANTVVAKLYDPTTGVFGAERMMQKTRACASATLLQDGRVLIAGRGSFTNRFTGLVEYTGYAELYDPVTDTFQVTGSMVVPRCHHQATLLNNGQVLFVGIGGLVTGPSAELYDPMSGTFRATGAMVKPRDYGMTNTLLRDGRILITGGAVGSNLTSTNTVEIYNPATGTFSSAMPMRRARQGATATMLSNPSSSQGGRVLITGGLDLQAPRYWADAIYQQTAEMYDPTTGTFSDAGSLIVPRAFHSATPLPTGQILIAGGNVDYSLFPDDNGSTYTAELYDPSVGTFVDTGSMLYARSWPSAALIDRGGQSWEVLVMGRGWGLDFLPAEIYRDIPPAPRFPPPIVF